MTRDPVREALEWYGEQARLVRLVHREGDAARHALDADGGKRAREALAASTPDLGGVNSCPQSPNGRHQVDTSMESGPNNCFHCERPMPATPSPVDDRRERG